MTSLVIRLLTGSYGGEAYLPGTEGKVFSGKDLILEDASLLCSIQTTVLERKPSETHSFRAVVLKCGEARWNCPMHLSFREEYWGWAGKGCSKCWGWARLHLTALGLSGCALRYMEHIYVKGRPDSKNVKNQCSEDYLFQQFTTPPPPQHISVAKPFSAGFVCSLFCTARAFVHVVQGLAFICLATILMLYSLSHAPPLSLLW